MLRPKDVSDQLGISTATLRLWSAKFESFLSPSAQRSLTENGGPAQRRYTEQDVAFFQTAKQILADGLTYEDVLRKFDEGVAIVEYNNMPVSLPQPQTSGSAIALQAYEKTIAALEQTVKSQRQTIHFQNILLEELRSQRNGWEAPPAVLPASAPIVTSITWWQRIDGLLRKRMIGGQRNGADPAPEDSNQRQLPVQELA